MIKMNGTFLLGMKARNSDKIDSLTLTIDGTLMPVMMTVIKDINKFKDENKLEAYFEITHKNIVIEVGMYCVKLTGTNGKYNHITLISKLKESEKVSFSLPANTEQNNDKEVIVKFNLPKIELNKNLNNVH